MMLPVLLEGRLVELHQKISRSHLVIPQVWVLLDTLLVGKGSRMEITCQMGMGDGWREPEKKYQRQRFMMSEESPSHLPSICSFI